MGTHVSVDFSGLVLEKDETAVATKVNELLEEFVVDVVVVAPACRDVGTLIQIPPSWNRMDQVVLVVKPVEALQSLPGLELSKTYSI